MDSGLKAERFLVDLCNRLFLRGFVFHSPKYFDPGEKEVGDIVLWTRRHVIVFEVISRDANSGIDTRQFIKRIGEKRDQLLKDYKTFNDLNIKICLVNEQGKKVTFEKKEIGEFGFTGIVIVDCVTHIKKLHFDTVNKILEFPFPIAIMKQQDFLDLLSEVDTIPDLTYYLYDRFDFFKKHFKLQPSIYLDLNLNLEKNLMAFYKMYNNQFLFDKWEAEKTFLYYSIYKTCFSKRIISRNIENIESYIIDNIISIIQNSDSSHNSSLLHTWELSTLSRRQRAGWLSKKVNDAISRMQNGNSKRHFAYYNDATGCWLVFYFRYGGNRNELEKELEILIRYKLVVEMKENGFEHSVFGYAFRKAQIDTINSFDDIVLLIEDAESHSIISEDEYRRACDFFGARREKTIKEFPT